MSKKRASRDRVVDELARTALGKIRKAGGPGINPKQLALQIGLKDKAQRILLYEAIDLLLAQNRIKKGKKGRLKAPKRTSLTTGVIEFISNGNAFLRPENGGTDIFIRNDLSGNSFHGDTVKVKVSGGRNGGRPEGRVVEVVQRSRTTFVGTIGLKRKVYFLIPDDKRIPEYFAIKLDPGKALPEVGSKAVVELLEAGDASNAPSCRILNVLGTAGAHEVEINAIMWEFGLPIEFPPEVEREAAAIPDGVTPKEIKKRRDMRGTTTVTIDPHDAKDLDDALSIKALEGGNFEVGIHIADVSFYIDPKGLIEKEAKARATSVYLVDRVIPMLPEKLSNDLCSLNPHTDKLTYSAIFEMTPAGKVLNRWFGRTVIHCDHRFAYEDAQAVIDGGKHQFKAEVQSLYAISKNLRERRLTDGALEIISKEVRFRLGENGEPLEVFEKITTPANWLIEEFMLLANREVAKKGGSQQGKTRPFVYRVHDLPNEEKIAELKSLLKSFGHRVVVKKGETINHGMNRLLREIKTNEEAPVIQQMLIRAMAKATYSTENIGHYGLSFSHYSHFTSPIRRYPDLMVHRALEHYLKNGKPLNEGDMDLLCKHSSEREKAAAMAERASIRFKQVEYLAARRDEQFAGTINSVTKWGIFVTLDDNYCEGMVSLKDIGGDHYRFDPVKYEVRGQRTGRTFRIGDKVRVEITEVNMQRREVTLAFIEA